MGDIIAERANFFSTLRLNSLVNFNLNPNIDLWEGSKLTGLRRSSSAARSMAFVEGGRLPVSPQAKLGSHPYLQALVACPRASPHEWLRPHRISRSYRMQRAKHSRVSSESPLVRDKRNQVGPARPLPRGLSTLHTRTPTSKRPRADTQRARLLARVSGSPIS